MSRAQIVQVLEDEDNGVFDREEVQQYTTEQLMVRFGIENREDADLLWLCLQDDLPGRCVYGIEEENAQKFLLMVQESIHQSFEGPWTPEDKVVIRAYLADIAYAMSLS